MSFEKEISHLPKKVTSTVIFGKLYVRKSTKNFMVYSST